MKNTQIFEPTIEHALVVCIALKVDPFEIAPLGFDTDDSQTDSTIIEKAESLIAKYSEQCRTSQDDSVTANKFRGRIRWCSRLMMGYEKLPENDAQGKYILPVGLGSGIYVFHDVMEVGE